MAWIIALLIGCILGWGACMLLDYLFWRNKRICPEAKDNLQTTISRLEVEKTNLQAKVAKLRDTSEGKDIEVATLRARIRESEVEPIATKIGYKDKLKAENANSDAAHASTTEIQIDAVATDMEPAAKKPKADTPEPAELINSTRTIGADSAAKGIDAVTQQVAEATETAKPFSCISTTKDEPALIATDPTVKPAAKDIKPASQYASVLNHEGNQADKTVERNHQAQAMNTVMSAGEHQSIQSSETTNKTLGLHPQEQNNLQIDTVVAGTDAAAVAVKAQQRNTQTDNLACIWGIGKNKQKALNEVGIYTFEQLAAKPLSELDQLVAEGGDRFKLANQTSWLEQVQLAATEQWEDLHVLQERLKVKLWQETGGFTLRDNLREIWGIGKSKQRALYKAGYHIYKQLATTPVSYFDKFVAQRRDHFNLANQKTWPEQARLSVSEQWGALRVLQNKLKAECRADRDDLRIIWGIGKKKQKALGKSGIFTFEQLAATPVSDLDELVAKDLNQFNHTNQATWPEQAWLAVNEQWEELHTLQTKLMSEVVQELAANSRDHHDNLRSIWGVGKKKQRVLNDAGIFTFEQLIAFAISDLDKIVAHGRGDFNLANQSTWSEQAQLAIDRQWGKLRVLQGKLKAEDYARRDNLRFIWSIGKKKQKALHKIGIYTFEQLAITPISDFDVLMTKGGGDFNLANQSTWPKQARLAASGDWRALRGYQQVLARTRQGPLARMSRDGRDRNPQSL